MYSVKWDNKTGGIKLLPSGDGDVASMVRPVFYEELDILGFGKYWDYPKSEEPLLWSVGRSYFYNGEKVAQASGGGFYEYPKLHIFKEGLSIEPVDVDKMVKENIEIIESVAHTTLDFISEMYVKYKNKIDKTVVAFSGGKDSTVLLDLVQRVLSPDEYIVVFNDTTMELSPTYEFIEKIKKKYSNLMFLVSRYEKPAIEMWREVGVPSKIHRWCCTIYKTVPTIKLIQELIKKETPKILLYDGIRGDESLTRAKLSHISRGKHLQQINIHPIIDWNSAMVYLYIFMRDLPLNKLYRYGIVRVGCAVCPFESYWKEAILWLKFRDEIKPYLEVIEKYARDRRCKGSELKEFVKEGVWKKRVGNKGLNLADKVNITEEKDKATVISINTPNENWFEWIKTLGKVVVGNPSGYIEIKGIQYPFKWQKTGNNIKIKFTSKIKNDDLFYIKNVSYKSAYCIRCGTCEIECPSSAIKIERDKIRIDEKKCKNCYRCLTFIDRGCIVADSYRESKVVKSMNNIARYRTFGMRKEWLEEFFSDTDKWWIENKLGPIQKISMRLWLTDSEILEVKGNKIILSKTGELLREIGASDLFTWAIIWTNLVRNSPLIEWYVQRIPWGRAYNREELIQTLGEEYRVRTRKNAILELVQLFDYTPLGRELKIGVPVKRGKTTTAIEKIGLTNESDLKNLHQLAVLYSLYRYSEKTSRYHFTVSELYEASAIEGPYKLFGIPKTLLEKILIGLEELYGKNWINVELVADLDNINLNPTKNSMDVLKLYAGVEYD
ncbi:phosphoadenosine phosphosulfate reductase family protein [Archaeoglobus sp.]|uniref:Phosphoadenosine phosphosulfate reductase n=1 Tax=Archaeoglobus fulgidus TaxID=2234 RepID=A0A101E374_ARCFL|nr:phosphoadenosine phosphosulfate reductase family protein [Archaeoglobus sp.]KUK07756.1 MAG: Phosphoadenosine phosphosulfate reductase [Archaeoglobus fulgidus]MDI3497056.1 hypothetical protein [Archaeoglobus sp.]